MAAAKFKKKNVNTRWDGLNYIGLFMNFYSDIYHIRIIKPLVLLALIRIIIIYCTFSVRSDPPITFSCKKQFAFQKK